jgi:hypothetical protein
MFSSQHRQIYSFCADCSGVYAVPTSTTGISFVLAYIHKEDGANVGTTVTMSDSNEDDRYIGKWIWMQFAEIGTYYVNIIAFDVRGNEAEVDNAVYFFYGIAPERNHFPLMFLFCPRGRCNNCCHLSHNNHVMQTKTIS